MSCPYTSQQNGKAESVLCTLNNIVRSLLFQGHLPPPYWVEALHAATYLLNRHPTKTLHFLTPHQALYGRPPTYNHLRVFGCRCYPNTAATAPHKLAPRSTLCVFLGYSPHHKGYRCLDVTTNRIIISRHVVFDESSFPFVEASTLSISTNLDFLDEFLYQDAVSVTPPPDGFRARPPPSVGPAGTGPGGVEPGGARPPIAGPPSAGAAARPGIAGPPPAGTGDVGTSDDGAGALTRSSPSAGVESTGSPSAGSSGPASGAGSHSPGAAATPGLQQRSPDPWCWVVPPDVVCGRSARLSRDVSVPQRIPAGAVPVPPVVNTHGMRTRAKDGFRQPRLNLQAIALSPVPSSYRHALDDPHWRAAMEDEFQALVANNTWTLIQGALGPSRLHPRPGVDYDETFIPVVKPATIRTVLSLAISDDWPVHQLDVSNAFLHGTLTETVYCSRAGFVDNSRPDYVCRLNKSLYGLKQAPWAWYSCFAAHLRSLGFVEAKSDTSLFISPFPMKDLGPLQHFLGIAITRSSTAMLLSQSQYILDVLDRAGMTMCKPCSTPVDTQAKLAATGNPVADPTTYHSLVGALQYVTFTRPDVTYAVQQVCLYMHDPREPHLMAVKRILRYLRGTADLGLSIGRSPSSFLTVYTDADWAGCPDTRKSTSGYAVFLGDNLVSWSSKRQQTVSRSSAEAEYHAVANGVAEASWLRQLLQELHQPLQRATLMYCDNVSAVYLSTNPVQHQRTKHVEIDLHFVRERVAAGSVRVLHVPTTSQFADLFTKGLPTAIFQEFRSSMNVRPTDAPAAGGVSECLVC
ncbi:hypothetical protein U9M48_038625 [Paspalum notatum var. saurae]|uniref:Integrase catalytic domain-containing protein n=1 Tax=Paspalum notatum var. saurae TaxID=547442 RepID=A0AAQ3UNL4_PASNO